MTATGVRRAEAALFRVAARPPMSSLSGAANCVGNTGCDRIQSPWRRDRGTISTNLHGIWEMSEKFIEHHHGGLK